MKKSILKLLTLITLIVFTACSSLFSSGRVKEEAHTVEQAKNWDKTLSESLKKNALIAEWYAAENPIIYLRRTGKMDEKQFKFLESLKTNENITKEDLEKFDGLVLKYNNKIEREFYLSDENIKDGKGLVRKIVEDANERLDNPSKYIFANITEGKQWTKIVELSKKDDLDEDDITDLRKILNKIMKDENFFDYKVWLNIEVSERTTDLIRLANIQKKSDLEQNNLNAKAFYVAYTEYLSKMDRWDD